MVRPEPSARPSEARDRLLGTATTLFYSTGIRAVGVERIVAEASVTRATFYRHFPAKDALVAAYLERIHRAVRDQHDAVVASGRPAADILRDIGRGIAEEIRAPGFRGCAFLNAAAEFPDPDHPVHRAVLAHRRWFQAAVTDLFRQIGGFPADGSGRHFVMLRDGATTAGHLDDPVRAGETFLRGVEGLLRLGVA